MKIRIITFVVVFLSLSAFSQSTKTTIYFNDGSEEAGLGKLITKNRIKFRRSIQDDPEKMSFSTIAKVKMEVNGSEKTYRLVAVEGKKKPLVLEELIVGELSLYRSTVHGQTPRYAGSGFGPGASGMAGGSFFSINNYYVKKRTESEAIHLASNQLFKKNFRKGSKIYFKGCPSLVEKIQGREYKKRDLEEIIKYYNSNCI